MIAFLNGEVTEITEELLVLESNGIGYNIKISTSTAGLLPSIGSEVKVHTYLYVREDIMSLYGFLKKDDLGLFKMLIGVNGIGPKGALAVLSVMSGDDLRFAIISGDSKSISKAPGVGAKTAQRVILDLKDKVSLEEAFELRSEHTQGAGIQTDNLAKSEAMEALTALGYSGAEALKAIKQSDIPKDADAETILKLALKKLAYL